MRENTSWVYVGMFGRFHCTCPEYSLWQHREDVYARKGRISASALNSLINLNGKLNLVYFHWNRCIISVPHWTPHNSFAIHWGPGVLSAIYKSPFWHLSMPLTMLQCCTKEFQRVQRVFALRRIACTFPLRLKFLHTKRTKKKEKENKLIGACVGCLLYPTPYMMILS